MSRPPLAAARAALVAGAIGLALATPAGAAAPAKQGWWTQAQTAAVPGVALPAPPTVPADGLFVASDPSGEEAMSALRFELGGATPDVLELHVNDLKGTPLVGACPVAGSWEARQGGPYAQRPAVEPTGCTPGTLSADGTKVTFAVGSLVRNGALDVGLVAGRDASGQMGLFQLSFTKPDATALHLEAEAEDESTATPPDLAAPPPSPATAAPVAAAAAPGSPEPPPSAIGAVDAFVPATPATAPAEADPLPDPLVGSAAGASGSLPQVALGLARATGTHSPGRDALTAFGLAGFTLVMGVWWVLQQQPEREPRLLTSFRPSGSALDLHLDDRGDRDDRGRGEEP